MWNIQKLFQFGSSVSQDPQKITKLFYGSYQKQKIEIEFIRNYWKIRGRREINPSAYNLSSREIPRPHWGYP